MNENKVKQVLSKCEKIGKLIRIVWGFFVLGIILTGFSIFLMFTGRAEKSDFQIVASKVGDETVYDFQVGKGEPIHILLTDSSSKNITLNKTGLENPHWVTLLFALTNYLVLCLLFSIVSHIRRIFLNFPDDETPFTRKNCLHIKKIGWTAVALSLIEPMLFPLLCTLLGFGSFSFAIDFAMLVIGGSCLALAHIFEYGEALQKESDELL